MRFFLGFILLMIGNLCYAQDIRQGDLFFIVEGKSEFSNAISSATSSSDSISFVHVAIADIDESGQIQVIEASPHAGVRIINLQEFLDSVPKINGKPAVVVKRVISEFSPQSAILNAKSHIGEPYDWWYLPDNGKMYCSELIYESFRDKNGERIFSSQPINFKNPDGTIDIFWTRLFEKLDEKIPEGVSGTNPNSMSKEDFLENVYTFF